MGITHHAIEQYRARFGGDEDALRELVSAAAPTRERTPGGQEVWAADGVRLVVKRDRGVGPVVVTVLPAVVTEESEDEMPEGGWW